uniref:Granulins domain-containing protein n=1 Tax=Callorhinchus milii TaxID=7868 RepID=A0A4W3JKB4_CALMI
MVPANKSIMEQLLKSSNELSLVFYDFKNCSTHVTDKIILSISVSNQATCCNDGVHCCPHGMNCDAENSFCTTDSIRIPWFNKKPALIATDVVNSVGRDSSVVNCDKTYFCKDGLTCCPTAMGRWGCCPFPNKMLEYEMVCYN